MNGKDYDDDVDVDEVCLDDQKKDQSFDDFVNLQECELKKEKEVRKRRIYCAGARVVGRQFLNPMMRMVS